MYDGISAFDQKNSIFYYTADFESSFLFAIDVHNASLLPPLSISADYVSQYVGERGEGEGRSEGRTASSTTRPISNLLSYSQLLVTGEYSDPAGREDREGENLEKGEILANVFYNIFY
jgi:hypothetical protein